METSHHQFSQFAPSGTSIARSEMDSSSTPTPADLKNETPIQIEDEPEFMTPDSGGKRKDAYGGTCDPKKAPRVLTPRSKIWEHYTRAKDDRNKCICHYCERIFSCATKSGTSNLLKHMGICKQYKAWTETQTKIQPVISEEWTLKLAKVTESMVREVTNEMIVLGELPLAFIESEAWKHFCKKVNLSKPHSQRTATRDIVELFVQKKLALKHYFQSNKQRVSLTTDIWVAQTTGASYMVITAHYIDPCWRLKKLIIGFKHITDHKGHTICKVLLDCLVDWGIEKVFCVTVDNASANSAALRKFQTEFSLLYEDSLVLDGDFMHVRCSAHIINLIVKGGMAEVDDNVSAIRNAVVYVRSHPNRLASFEQKVDAGKISKGSLPLDMRTRWNSTYLMLSTSLKFKSAFERMEAEDKLYNDYFLEIDNGKKREGPPEYSDWKAIERLGRFLVIFFNSTLVVSASTSVNAYKCYREIVIIATNLMSLSNSLDSDLRSKAVEMLKKFDMYWDGLKNINKMLIVDTVFDPTKKMELANMCFEELYGKESLEAKEMYDSVIILLRSMFKEYSLRYGQGSEQEVQTSGSQSSRFSLGQASEMMEMVDDGLGYKRIGRRYKEMINEIGVKEERDELETYLKEGFENPYLMAGVEYDVLSFWKRNCTKYPILSEMARDVLAMQVSSVASESAFITSGRILEPSRSCLTHYMVEVLMCTEQWMKQDIRHETRLPTNAQILEEIQEEEDLQREFD